MNEFMGLIKGMYEAKQGGFLPGGRMLLGLLLVIVRLQSCVHMVVLQTLLLMFIAGA
jgi:hypothetical protein